MRIYTEIVPDPDGKIMTVDYLKGFSIFTIALMHLLGHISALPSIINTLAAVGGTGVHVFFLCSGVGLYLSYLKCNTTFFAFLKKRFFKIYIPYIIVILFAFFVPWLYYGESRVTALLSHVFLFKMFSPMYESSFSETFWFVSTIFQLYALFIPMCWVRSKLKNGKLFALLFTGLSVMWWLLCYYLNIGSVRIWGSFCLQYIWEFALGFLLAEAFYYQKQYKLNNFVLLAFAVLGIGLQAAAALYLDALKSFNDIPALVGYMSLALLFSNIPIVRKLCDWLSRFSYEFYLVHDILFVIAFQLLKPRGLMVQCFVAIAAMVIAFVVAYFYSRIIKMVSARIKKSC